VTGSPSPGDIPAQLAEALRDRYALERELGRGGMATVYLAHDRKHDRPVALKVLHAELAATLGPERFQREIRLAARLQHPHILTVLDSGEAAGHLWFTMPFVEGESLRDRLNRERQLPVEDALRITREAAQGLQYAHEHGVMHRDIKPENILLTQDGSTLVADFGIARAFGGGEARLTETGMAIGTPAYMSPEQASGDQTLDARTDIYSLGCVLFEMLAGEPPFTGPTVQAIIAKRLTQPVPSVRQSRPTVPQAAERALRQALAPIPADRFATAGDLARALQTSATPRLSAPSQSGRRRLPVAALMLVLGFLIGLGVLFAWRRSHSGGGDGAGPKRIAVLPFENLGDSTDAYFADGMTDEVRGKLSQLSGLAVIARSSSNEYRRSNKSPQEIARELGAEYLLTATVRWEKTPGAPSRVRVSPELVQVEPGAAPTTRWQQGFDASLTDVFQVQGDIAGKVATALDVALGESARNQLEARPTANLAAYDAFLKGEAASQVMSVGDPASLRRAIGHYEQAVALDSAFVSAWTQLARARSILYANGTPTPALAAEARRAADRAQSLAPERPEGQLASGMYYVTVAGDNRRPLAAFEAGLKLAPTNVDLLVGAALAEQTQGRWDSAREHLARAGALDPRSANTARRTGFNLLFLRRYAEARTALERALALAPNNFVVIEQQAMVALAQGDLTGARAIVRAAATTAGTAAPLAYFATYWDLYWVLEDAQQQQVLALPPSAFDDDRGSWAIVRAQTYALGGNTVQARVYADSARLAFDEQLRESPEDAQRHAFRGLALAYLGRKAEAIAEGERAVRLAPISRNALSGAYLQHQLARIYLLVDEPEKALDQLEPLLRMPYFLSPGWLRIDPTFAPLKGNPRFERLVAQ
jgi:serine/threonine-protein kinase